MTTTTIGLIGLGAIGQALAHNWQAFLKSKGYPPLVYWNRTISKGDHVKDTGAIPAKSPLDLAEQCDIIFLSLAGDQASKDVLQSMKDALQGKIVCDTSTVHPDTSSYSKQYVEEHSGHFIASPVFGAAAVAWKGNLIIAAAGSKKSLESVMEYYNAVSKKVLDLGEDVRKASVMKITANIFITGLMELVGEAQAFGDANGISAEKMTEWSELFGGPVLASYFRKNSDGIYDPGPGGSPSFSVVNTLKDLGYGKQLAADKGFKLQVAEIMTENLKEICETRDGTRLDGSSVYGLHREKAGLDFENEAVKARKSS